MLVAIVAAMVVVEDKARRRRRMPRRAPTLPHATSCTSSLSVVSASFATRMQFHYAQLRMNGTAVDPSIFLSSSLRRLVYRNRHATAAKVQVHW